MIFWALKSRAPGIKARSILETIVEDATRYFLVIFTSHLVVELTLKLGRVSAPVAFSFPVIRASTHYTSLCRKQSSFFRPRKLLILPTLRAIILITLFSTAISGNVV